MTGIPRKLIEVALPLDDINREAARESKAGWGEPRVNDPNRRLRQYAVIWPNPELVETCARLRVRQEEGASVWE